MKCRLESLSALSDGDLSSKEAERVRAHLAGCADCRRELESLQLLRAQLSSLPPPERAAEPGDLNDSAGWLALQRRLVAEPPRAQSAWARWSWRRWALAPAFLAVAATALWVHQRAARGVADDTLLEEAEVEFRGAETQYRHALDKLDQVTAHARVDWPAARSLQYDSARASLEAATEQCRRVALSKPADPESEELLFAAYRKQIRFSEEQLLK